MVWAWGKDWTSHRVTCCPGTGISLGCAGKREGRDPKHSDQENPSGVFPRVGTKGKLLCIEWKPIGQCRGLTNLTFMKGRSVLTSAVCSLFSFKKNECVSLLFLLYVSPFGRGHGEDNTVWVLTSWNNCHFLSWHSTLLLTQVPPWTCSPHRH